MDSLPSTPRLLGCFAVCILAWALVEALLAGGLMIHWPVSVPTGLAVTFVAQAWVLAGVAVIASLQWAYRS